LFYVAVKDTSGARAALARPGKPDFLANAYGLPEVIGSDSLMHVRFNANHAALGLPPASKLDADGIFQWVEKEK